MNAGPTTYAIRVDGHLDDHWSAWLGELELTRDEDGATTVTVTVADQAQLHGVLVGLRDIGAVLTELRSTGPAPSRRPVLAHPLRTEHLTLRPATTDDAGAAWRLRRPGSVDAWLGDPPVGLDGFRGSFCEPARLSATVIVTLGHDARGPVIGEVMLRREDAWTRLRAADRASGAHAELAWVLGPACTRHRHAAEALRELLRHCFEGLGVRRVTADCFIDDDGSWRLMECIGMRRERHAVREWRHRSGRWLDTVGYAILEDEWSPA